MERVGMHERRERERESSQETRAETSDDQRAGDGPWGTLGWARARGELHRRVLRKDDDSEREPEGAADHTGQAGEHGSDAGRRPNRPDTRLMTLRLGCILYGRGHCITACVHPLTQRRRSTERTDVGRPRPRAIHPVVRGVNRKAMAGCQPAVVAARCFWCSRA